MKNAKHTTTTCSITEKWTDGFYVPLTTPDYEPMQI